MINCKKVKTLLTLLTLLTLRTLIEQDPCSPSLALTP
jgi:hypothetical protein